MYVSNTISLFLNVGDRGKLGVCVYTQTSYKPFTKKISGKWFTLEMRCKLCKMPCWIPIVFSHTSLVCKIA